jgi:hypothetical protein
MLLTEHTFDAYLSLVQGAGTNDRAGRRRSVSAWSTDHELFDDARRDPADAVGPAQVVSEGVLVEVGLEVLGADCTSVGAQKPALEQRDRPVATLDGVVLAPLGLSALSPRGAASPGCRRRSWQARPPSRATRISGAISPSAKRLSVALSLRLAD